MRNDDAETKRYAPVVALRETLPLPSDPVALQPLT